jgi:hypothetical protein
MAASTIERPALLGRPGAYAREAARLQAHARSPGLFDLPIAESGPSGHTRTEAEALRAYRMLAEAFGLGGDALAEWHDLFAHGVAPRPDGSLLRIDAATLADLMLRVRTLAQYHDREGRGAAWMRIGRRGRPLQRLADEWPAAVAYAREIFEAAGATEVTPAMVARVVQSAGLYRELRRHTPNLIPLMPAVHHEARDAVAFSSVRDLRAWLLHRGLSASGWRWLAANPARFATAQHWTRQDTLPATLVLANTLALAGVGFCPSPGFALASYPLAVEAVCESCPPEAVGWVLRAGWEHCRRMPHDQQLAFAETTFPMLSVWSVTREWRPDANQRRAGWPALQRAWRNDVRRRTGAIVEWAVPFECLRDGGLVARPLGDSVDLAIEAAEMGNCIEEFLEACVSGEFLAFSLCTTGGARIATFSFQRECGADAEWTFHQMAGPRNEPVRDRRVAEFIAIVLQRVNEGG